MRRAKAERQPVVVDQVHRSWDASLPPAAVVDSGQRVRVNVWAGASRLNTATIAAAEARRHHDPESMPLTGPIGVRGGHVGQVLRVDILEITTDPFGYTSVEPGVGLLGHLVRRPLRKVWRITEDGYAEFGRGIRVRASPFLGTIGVAPSGPARGTRTPAAHGGNLDLKHLTVGSTLWLPIQVDGALLSAGDAHAAQGDGEICGTAIETGATATLRLSVVGPDEVPAPAYRRANRGSDPQGVSFCGLGIQPDLFLAARQASAAALHYLVGQHALDEAEAYALLSVAADLAINEVVDDPNWVVSCCIPLEVFAAS